MKHRELVTTMLELLKEYSGERKHPKDQRLGSHYLSLGLEGQTKKLILPEPRSWGHLGDPELRKGPIWARAGATRELWLLLERPLEAEEKGKKYPGFSAPPKFQSPALPLTGKPRLELVVKRAREAELVTVRRTEHRQGTDPRANRHQPAQPLTRKRFINIFVSRLKRNSYSYHAAKPSQILFISSIFPPSATAMSLPISPLH